MATTVGMYWRVLALVERPARCCYRQFVHSQRNWPQGTRVKLLRLPAGCGQYPVPVHNLVIVATSGVAVLPLEASEGGSAVHGDPQALQLTQ